MPGIIPNAEIRAVQAAGTPPLPAPAWEGGSCARRAHAHKRAAGGGPNGAASRPASSLGSFGRDEKELTGSSGATRQDQLEKKISGLHLGLTKGNIAVREETQLDYLKVPSGFQKCVQKSVRDS